MIGKVQKMQRKYMLSPLDDIVLAWWLATRDICFVLLRTFILERASSCFDLGFFYSIGYHKVHTHLVSIQLGSSLWFTL